MALILINQQKKVQIPKQLETDLNLLAQKCLEKEKIDTDAEISLVLTDDENIKELNKIYRGKDVPTDVLSFPMYEGLKDSLELIKGEEEILLGDIIISLEKAQYQAEQYGHSLEREVSYLMIHGLLHLLGYDHMTEEDKKIMRKKEEEFLSMIGLER